MSCQQQNVASNDTVGETNDDSSCGTKVNYEEQDAKADSAPDTKDDFGSKMSFL